jgi:hypothetical protein
VQFSTRHRLSYTRDPRAGFSRVGRARGRETRPASMAMRPGEGASADAVVEQLLAEMIDSVAEGGSPQGSGPAHDAAAPPPPPLPVADDPLTPQVPPRPRRSRVEHRLGDSCDQAFALESLEVDGAEDEWLSTPASSLLLTSRPTHHAPDGPDCGGGSGSASPSTRNALLARSPSWQAFVRKMSASPSPDRAGRAATPAAGDGASPRPALRCSAAGAVAGGVADAAAGGAAGAPAAAGGGGGDGGDGGTQEAGSAAGAAHGAVNEDASSGGAGAKARGVARRHPSGVPAPGSSGGGGRSQAASRRVSGSGQPVAAGDEEHDSGPLRAASGGSNGGGSGSARGPSRAASRGEAAPHEPQATRAAGSVGAGVAAEELFAASTAAWAGTLRSSSGGTHHCVPSRSANQQRCGRACAWAGLAAVHDAMQPACVGVHDRVSSHISINATAWAWLSPVHRRVPATHRPPPDCCANPNLMPLHPSRSHSNSHAPSQGGSRAPSRTPSAALSPQDAGRCVWVRACVRARARVCVYVCVCMCVCSCV